MSDRPADWYADPGEPGRLRYWDGSGWTEHVSDSPQPHDDRWSLAMLAWGLGLVAGPLAAVPIYFSQRRRLAGPALRSIRLAAQVLGATSVVHVGLVAGLVLDEADQPWLTLILVNIGLIAGSVIAGVVWTRRLAKASTS